MSGKFAMRFLLSLGLVLSACAKKAEITQPEAPANPFPHLVEGESLDGHWVSACTEDDIQGGYSIYDVVIAGQNFERTVTRFEDTACTQFGVWPQTKRAGLFRYVNKYNLDIYEVEYRLNLEGANGFELAGENIRREKDLLWISYRGRGVAVNPSIPLYLIPN